MAGATCCSSATASPARSASSTQPASTSVENLGSVDILPDLDEVMGLIGADLLRSVAYGAVKNAQLLHHFEPSNGDRFLDDVFVSPDGTVLYVSRSNLGDVAACGAPSSTGSRPITRPSRATARAWSCRRPPPPSPT
jgi:hypothetical protein